MHYRSNDPVKYKISSNIKTKIFKAPAFKFIKIIILSCVSLFLFYIDKKIDVPYYINSYIEMEKVSFYSYSDKVSNNLYNLKKNISDYISLKSKYRELENENILLKAKINELEVIESENRHLKKTLKFNNNPKFNIIKTANLIMTSANNQESIAYIDAGLVDGVKKGHAIINNRGLIGRVIESYERTSKVLLITSLNSQIPGVFVNNNASVIVGGGINGRLVVKINNSELSPDLGEILITSNDAKIFPPGIIIGRASSVSENHIEITPEFNSYKSSIVSVIESK